MNKPLLVTDQILAKELLQQRQECGADRYDEVWDGVYVMAPPANNEHQDLVSELTAVIKTLVDWRGAGKTLAGANVSDRAENWTKNHRVPDVLVFLNENSAEDRDAFWFGGPDLAIEVASEGDRSAEKLDFYAAVGTDEVLIVDRNPWKLTMYRRQDVKMVPVAVSSFTHEASIESEVVPIRFELNRDESALVMTNRSDGSLLRQIPVEQKD